MTARFKIEKGTPYPLGVTLKDKGINFSFVCGGKECSVYMYLAGKRKHPVKLQLSEEYRTGQIACCYLEMDAGQLEGYEFYADGHPVADPYAKVLHKDGSYGLDMDEFDWGNEQRGFFAYDKCIFYGLHVRGFTRHASSRVKARGTFAGIVEKIPYLKELGVTSLELMPAYEFESREEVLLEAETSAPEYFETRYKDSVPLTQEVSRERVNYWGYKEGNYFIPKRLYTYGKSPQREFKEMVKALHQNGLELIMQFYFPPQIHVGYMLEVLRYWKMHYHVDGFHLKGERIPVAEICREPLFSDTKLLYEDFPLQELYGGVEPAHKNLAYCRDDFLYDMRRFLKGDDGMVETFLSHQRSVSRYAGIVHYIANYYGFTLYDLVSYDKKHNEANGENNQDGSDYNISWNCGAEGPTRKKAVLELRSRQICNALCFVFLAQGTPFLMSGDEFGRTQKGNNNPYCQDNEQNWINWNLIQKNSKIYEFTKMIIAFRKAHPVFGARKELRMTDYLSCGYPDISYHGEEPWRPEREYNSRYVGILYCGEYQEKESAKLIYVLYNMHWDKHSIALPKLPKGMNWVLSFSTNEKEAKWEKQESKIELEGRTVCVYIAK